MTESVVSFIKAGLQVNDTVIIIASDATQRRAIPMKKAEAEALRAKWKTAG